MGKGNDGKRWGGDEEMMERIWLEEIAWVGEKVI